MSRERALCSKELAAIAKALELWEQIEETLSAVELQIGGDIPIIELGNEDKVVGKLGYEYESGAMAFLLDLKEEES